MSTTSGPRTSSGCCPSWTCPRSGRCGSSIDAANGMAGAMLPPVLERLPIEVVRCYFEPDGSFPNHEPNPLLPENREFIVAQDARGGRRPRGRVRRRRRPLLLRRRHAASSSRATSRRRCSPRRCWRRSRARRSSTTCARAGRCRRRSSAPAAWRSINRVGHAFIKHRMRKEDAAFGGEVSGHYYFRDFSQADSGVVPFLLMLELVSRRGRKLSEILAPLPGALLHHRRAEHAGRGRGAEAPGAEGAVRVRGDGLAPRRHLGRGRRTGTSTCARRTRSRCCASTSRRAPQELMERKRDEVLGAHPLVAADSRLGQTRLEALHFRDGVRHRDTSRRDVPGERRAAHSPVAVPKSAEHLVDLEPRRRLLEPHRRAVAAVAPVGRVLARQMAAADCGSRTRSTRPGARRSRSSC